MNSYLPFLYGLHAISMLRRYKMTRCLKLQSLSSSQFPSTDSDKNIADKLGKAEG